MKIQQKLSLNYQISSNMHLISSADVFMVNFATKFDRAFLFLAKIAIINHSQKLIGLQ